MIAGGTCIGEAGEVEPVSPEAAKPEKLGKLEKVVSYPSIRRIPPMLGMEERKRLLKS